jgi:methylenetetrahydrofolate dehydrogenase (NADP+)/methenyltetrahydrofolate cyclohydrolase
MNEKILDGKALADKLNLTLQNEISQAVEITSVKPKLVTILIGDDPASKVYLNMKKRTSASVGIESEILMLEEDLSEEKIVEEINSLNTNGKIHGILLQLPLPTSQFPNTLKYIE